MSTRTQGRNRVRTRVRNAILVSLLLSVGFIFASHASAFSSPTQRVAIEQKFAVSPTPVTTGRVPIAKAVMLGTIEGLTEFLPVSSTGHLLIAERLLVGTASEDAKTATDAYTVIIQIGAILAVVVVSRRRIVTVFQGIVGRNVDGRQLLIALVCAFVPAAVAGVALNKQIDKRLLKPTPVATAWLAGGLVIMFLTNSTGRQPNADVRRER